MSALAIWLPPHPVLLHQDGKVDILATGYTATTLWLTAALLAFTFAYAVFASEPDWSDPWPLMVWIAVLMWPIVVPCVAVYGVVRGLRWAVHRDHTPRPRRDELQDRIAELERELSL